MTGCCFGSRQRLVVFGVVFWVRLSYAFEWSVSVDSCLERANGSLPSFLQLKCHSRCVCLLCLVTTMCAVCAGRCAIPAVCMQHLLLTSQLSWLLWDGCYARRVHVPCGRSYERPARVCAAMAGLGPGCLVSDIAKVWKGPSSSWGLAACTDSPAPACCVFFPCGHGHHRGWTC